MQGLSQQEISDYTYGQIQPRKKNSVTEDDETARLRRCYPRVKCKIRLYYYRIRDVMFPTKDKMKRKGMCETIVKLELDAHKPDDESDTNDDSLLSKSTKTSKASRLSKKLKIGNLDEQYLLWSILHYSQFTDNVIDESTMREVLKQCWFQDYTKIGIYDFKDGETISECGYYLIDNVGFPVVRFIPHKAYVPTDNNDIYVVGDMKVKPLCLNFNVPSDREKYVTYCFNLAKQKDMLMLGMNPNDDGDLKDYDKIIETGQIHKPLYNDTIPEFRYDNDGMMITYDNPNTMTAYLQYLCDPKNALTEFYCDDNDDDHIVDTPDEMEEELVQELKSDSALSSLTGSFGELKRNSKPQKFIKERSVKSANSKQLSAEIVVKCNDVAKNNNCSMLEVESIVSHVLDFVSASTDNKSALNEFIDSNSNSSSNYYLPINGKPGGKVGRNSQDLTGDEQDLYETPDWVIECLIAYLNNVIPTSSLLLLDPCCGPRDIIVQLFQQHGSHLIQQVMSTDKFYGDKIDFIDGVIDGYDMVNMIITNPPWGKKIEFVTKCYDDGKSFCLLLPLVTLGVIALQEYFIRFGMNVMILSPIPKFHHEDKDLFTGPVAWFCYFVGMKSEIKIAYLYKN